MNLLLIIAYDLYPNTYELVMDAKTRGELLHTLFFRYLMEADASRDYTIIVDRSTSMKLKGRWAEAEAAVGAVCEATAMTSADQGITLYFFSSPSPTHNGDQGFYFVRYDGMKAGREVMEKFKLPSNQPRGGTDLSRVLQVIPN